MKYLLVLVAATAALISVEAEIPSYIKRCKRHDPKIGHCILDSIEDLREKLSTGIDELSVPPLDPLHFEQVHVELGPGIKAEIRNLSLHGLKAFTLGEPIVDFDKDIIIVNITIPSVTINGIYDMDAKLAGIPLRGKGPIYFSPKLITGFGKLHSKKSKRAGKTFYWFQSMDLKLDITDYEIRLDNLFTEQPQIGEVTNRLLNEEKADVMKSLLPGLEKSIVEKVLLIGNNICKEFTFDELFPES